MRYRGMTREEAIFCEKSYIGESNCTDCKYYGTETCQSRESHKMAIKALEQEPVLDKIRAEFVSLYPKNYIGELELGGLSCVFSLNKVIEIIDKYKAESEE
jgi:hypothetical protein